MCILPDKEERGDAAVTPNISAMTIVYVLLTAISARDPKGSYYQHSDG